MKLVAKRLSHTVPKLCKRVSGAFNLNVIIQPNTTPNLRGTGVNEIDRSIIGRIKDCLCNKKSPESRTKEEQLCSMSHKASSKSVKFYNGD